MDFQSAEIMTLSIQAAIAEGDFEAAKFIEFKLYQMVLEAIAAGCNPWRAQQLAKMALRSDSAFAGRGE